MQGRFVTSGEDRISILPESLLCLILNFLTTKDSVKTSVLSSSWRNLWLWVPRLDLQTSDFRDDNACVRFVHKFLNFRGESYLCRFKLSIHHDLYENSPFEACLAKVAKCKKIQRFEIGNTIGLGIVKMPLIVSMCDTLVSLKLSFVILSDLGFDFESCSLPCLKIMHLDNVIFPVGKAAEALISCSPVLEELALNRRPFDNVGVLRVSSKSLKSFTLKRGNPLSVGNGKHRYNIDTPRLEYLALKDYQYQSFGIISMNKSVKVDIDVLFEVRSGGVLSERNDLICNFLTFVSDVRDMIISRRTLEVFYNYLKMNPGFKFLELARLRATMFSNSSPEMLPVILETCPNLKHLTLELVHDSLVTEGISGLSILLPRCLVSSLESVDIESPITDKATELKLVSYFLQNSTTLKKVVLRLNKSSLQKHEPSLLEELVESLRRSSFCQLVIITHC